MKAEGNGMKVRERVVKAEKKKNWGNPYMVQPIFSKWKELDPPGNLPKDDAGLLNLSPRQKRPKYGSYFSISHKIELLIQCKKY